MSWTDDEIKKFLEEQRDIHIISNPAPESEIMRWLFLDKDKRKDK